MNQADLWHSFKQEGSQAAREQLILAHLRYVKPTVQRLVPNVPAAMERADLEAEAMLAVVKAVDRFDPARAMSAASWVIACIRFHLREYLRTTDWAPRSVRAAERRGEVVPLVVVSLEATGRVDGQEDLDMSPLHAWLIDPAPSPFAQVAARQETAAVRLLVRALPAAEREVILAYYWQERLQTDIARRIGLSDSRVKQIRQRALERLRQFSRGRRLFADG